MKRYLPNNQQSNQQYPLREMNMEVVAIVVPLILKLIPLAWVCYSFYLGWDLGS